MTVTHQRMTLFQPTASGAHIHGSHLLTHLDVQDPGALRAGFPEASVCGFPTAVSSPGLPSVVTQSRFCSFSL